MPGAVRLCKKNKIVQVELNRHSRRGAPPSPSPAKRGGIFFSDIHLHSCLPLFKKRGRLNVGEIGKTDKKKKAIKIERYIDYSKLYQIQYIEKQYVVMYLTT
jgi:hypothetical protein